MQTSILNLFDGFFFVLQKQHYQGGWQHVNVLLQNGRPFTARYEQVFCSILSMSCEHLQIYFHQEMEQAQFSARAPDHATWHQLSSRLCLGINTLFSENCVSLLISQPFSGISVTLRVHLKQTISAYSVQLHVQRKMAYMMMMMMTMSVIRSFMP